MAFDPNSMPKDLRPINVMRHVNEDSRLAPMTASVRPMDGFYATSGNVNPLPTVYYQSTAPDAGFVPIGFNNGVPAGWIQHVVPSQAQPGIVPSQAQPGIVPSQSQPGIVPSQSQPGIVPSQSQPGIVPSQAQPGIVPSQSQPGIVPSQSQPSIVPSQSQPGIVPTLGVSSAGGYTSSPRYDARSVSDRASEDNGDDSVSGRSKVKFLCSFGGKILPRPSDGTLRYVGGQTRIISVRKDTSFCELVRKMTELYPEDVVIKYQLPDEDLDALVSVSCTDDLENMMDEYEKLVERSADGAARMRIFLFSPSDLESPMNVGDLNDGGFSYVEAINGVMDGFGSSGGDNSGRIARKESMESSTEGGDGSSHAHGEVTSLPSTVGFSPKESSSVVSDMAPRMMHVDPNPVQIDPSGAPFSGLVVQSGPATVLSADQVIDRSVPLTAQQSQHGVTFPVSSQYVPMYQDPRQEAFNRANYAQFQPQMGYPGQILGHVGPMFAQQPMPNGTGVSTHQYSQAGHMTMNSPLVSMRPGPTAAPSVLPPQQVHMDQYPAGNMVSQRVVQFGADQGYGVQNAHYHAPMQGGGYNWHQIPHPEQLVLTEGLNCQTILVPEKVPLVEDCTMCQKQLPHAHSDTVAQDLKESSASALSDSRSVYHSLCLDNRGKPMMAPVSTVAPAERNIEPIKIQTGVEVPEHSEVTRPSGVMLTSGVPSPYDVYLADLQPYQANAVQRVLPQPHVQAVQETAVERLLNNDFMPVQNTDHVVRESAPELYGNYVDGSPTEDSSKLAFDHFKQIDSRLENLHVRPSEILSNNEQAESYEVTGPPPSSNSDLYSNLMLGVNDYVAKDNILRTQPIVTGDNSLSPISPSYGAGDVPDNSASLFSNQDPWNLGNDTHFPPPRPSKIQVRKENSGNREGDGRLMNKSESLTGNGRDSPPGEGLHEQSGNLNRNLSSNKGSAEELIKQELQAVAEGVAASVLHSSDLSNSDLPSYTNNDSAFTPQQNGEVQRANVEVHHIDRFEEVKTKLPDKINLGLPASDGIGRLQIIRNNDLEELRELGSGTFGTVYHGKWRGTDVAIKRINDRCFASKPSEQERMRDDFWNEAVNLADLHHPNVVAFYGVVLDGPGGSIATVTEYMVNGSLRNALQKSERNLDKRKRLLIGMDVAFGMEYLHEKNIVHFDLKSDNLLVNLRDPHRPICKVGDLGLSKVKCQTLISGGVRGTLPWMAPELLNGSSSLVSEKVDVFSFGIVMWELLTGEEPYADLHYGAIIGGIVSNTLRPPVPQTCDPAWRSLMERCWSAEPSERPTFTEIASELRAMASQSPTKAQAQQL